MGDLQYFRVSYGSQGVARVAFNMPGRRYNVLNQQAFAELQAVVDQLADSPAVGCAVFSSTKESGFVAGADLKEIAALQDAEHAAHFVATGQRVFDQLEGLAIPTIAVIHGPCLGGGLEFALACRYRVARDDPSTRLGTPEVKLGLMPAWGGIQRLPQRIGLEAALQMLWTGRAVSAQQALKMGLVDAIWPPERFGEGVEQFVAALSKERKATNEARSSKSIQPGKTDSEVHPTIAEPQAILDAARRRLSRGRHNPELAAILQVLEHWQTGGRTAASAQERQLFPTLLFSGHCRRRLSRFFNRSRAPQSKPWVEGLTIGAVLRRTASLFGDRDAAVFLHAATRLSWAEMDRKVDRIARGLLALGLRRGDHFGVWSTNWPEWVYLQYAAARVGIVLVTINPSFRAAELEYTLAQSDVRGLALIERHRSAAYFDLLREVCPELDIARPGELRSQRLPKLRWVVRIRGAAHPGMIAWDDLEAAGDALPAVALEEAEAACRPGDPINLQYTSGTTGFPKGALLSHRNQLMNAFYTAQRQRLGPADRICLPVPLYHCFGCVLGTLCTLVSGAAMVFPQESFDAAAALDAVQRERCTAIYGVPTMFVAELEELARRSRDTSSLRTGIMAGAPCPIELMKRVGREMGASEITIAYGQTEASPLISMTSTDDPIEKRVGTVGLPLPGVEVKFVDVATGQDLPSEQSGELCCRGHDVMLGYYNLPQATAEAIDPEGWLHTGDLGLKQSDGYLRITGRLKDMIIRGGENIAPREIEELLYEHPQVEQAAVVGVPDPKFGEEVLAWIKLKAGESVTVGEIRNYCREHLAHFKAPRYIKFVDTFPSTVTGKIQKYRIRELAIEELGLRAASKVETA